MCVPASACIGTILSKYGFAGEPKCSPSELQINDIGRETIKESNRVMKIRDGYVLRIKEQSYCFLSNCKVKASCFKDRDPHK